LNRVPVWLSKSEKLSDLQSGYILFKEQFLNLLTQRGLSFKQKKIKFPAFIKKFFAIDGFIELNNIPARLVL